MFITKKSIPRRTLLKSMGATLALPFLDSMVPAVARAAAPVIRTGFVYMSNGTVIERWKPVKTGPNFGFSTILSPLEPFRKSAVVLSGLANEVKGTHVTASSGWLTGADPKVTEGNDVYNGTSIDQVIAAHIGHETVFPSLEIATEDFSSAIGSCQPGYSCIYANTIAWRNPATPLPMEINPRVVFERMFGQAGSATQRAARMHHESSILDSIGREVASMRNGLGAGDRRRFTDYLDNVREIEQRIQQAEKRSLNSVSVPDAPIGIPDSHDEHLKLMFDLMAVAWQTDMTRVFTFYTTRELSQLTYPEVGVTEPHHSVSHHDNDPVKMAAMALIGKYYSQQVARFLTKLQAMPDGDGTVLDHSVVLYGAGMSNSNYHTHVDLPLVALGGQFKGNRHLKFEKQPMANFWLTLADRAGAHIDSFGNSTGALDI